MGHKQIGWTTRFNAFYNDQTRPAGYKIFPSDGEGIQLEEELVMQGTSLKHILSWANIMFYDMKPSEVNAPNGLTLHDYQVILGFFNRFMARDLIVMGMEPGGQAAGGQWAGMEVSR